MFRSGRALGLASWKSGALRRLLLDRRAAVAAMAAIAFPVVIGTAGFGVDVGYWYVTQRNFQGAADAAAYSAAIDYESGDTSGYQIAAKAVAAQRGVVNGQNGVTVKVYQPLSSDPNASTSDPYYNNPNTVEVVITKTQPAMFASLVGQGNVTIAARSVALFSPLYYCMLALDQANATGISILSAVGSSTFNMPNCSIGDNASGTTALQMEAFLAILTLNAYTATVAGNDQTSCLFSCNIDFTKPPKYDATAPFTPIADPYASVSMPTPGTATTITPTTLIPSPCTPGTPITPSTPQPVPPGCYSGISFTGSGIVTTKGGGTYTIFSSASNKPAISVPNGATLTMNAGNYQILGVYKNGPTYTTTSQPAISISGGTITIDNGSNNTILGGSGQPGIAVSGGTMTMGSGTNSIQGGSGSPASAAISLSGTGHLATLDGGTYVIGPPSPTTYGIVVDTDNPACGFALWVSCAGQDLALGAGTYTMMGGIEVTGGNLTLNANGSSVGTYILYGNVATCNGGSTNVGLCMAFGDLNANDSTIVLTGNSASGYATLASGNVVLGVLGWGADGVNIIAPSTGGTSGIAIFQDRAAPASGSNTFAGLSFLNLQGALYFPAQNLSFVGSTIAVSNGGSSCYQLIANTIDIYTVAGITAFDDTGCPAAGATQISGLSIGLVE
jgi:Flp pilus assembly protein TadG